MSKTIDIHTNFKLEGHSFNNHNDLIRFVENKHKEHQMFVKELFNDNDYVFAVTSGSTGRAKNIKIDKQAMINSAKKTIDFFCLKPKTRALLNLSSDFIAGKMMWVRAIIGGWHLDISLPYNNKIREKLLFGFYDFGAMVPSQVIKNIDVISKIDKLIIGGGKISESLQKKLEGLNNEIYATYGMTETITHIAVKKIVPIKETAYKIFNDIEIETDKYGRLIISAPSLLEGKLLTNDLVEIIDKNHFKWLGRHDNIINSGGIKIIPESVEDKISSIIDKPFFVAGIPDDILGEKLVLIVESEGKLLNENMFIKRIKGFMKNKYEVPKRVFFINKFVFTKNGKIKRRNTLNKIIGYF